MTSKKLLVLDVNGLLVDTYFYKEPLPDESPDAKVGSFYVYKRPFCEEFLQFCLENFTVGIWSSAREYNVNNLVDYVFGGTKEKLAFSWHQSDCTDLGLKSPDNQRKPLFLKELTKLWRRVKGDLPWKEGNYGPSNTLLVDDTPYKAILNPPNTAIFPLSYTARNHGDNFLGGALRSYLEGIRDAESVQTYVEGNPFGEPSITPASPLWSYVNEVVLKVKNVLNNVSDGVAQIMPVETVSNEGNKEDRPKWCHGKWKHLSDSLQPVDEVVNEDNQAGKHKRWRNRKQKYQLANNHLQSSEFDFPSEVVESQSSDRRLQPLKSGEQVHGSDADQQVLETANVGGQGMVDTPLDQTGWVCCHSSQSVEEQERPLKRERPYQVGEGISSLPSGLEELSDAIQDRRFLSTELENYDGNDEKHCKNPGFLLSFEQGHQGALDLAKPAANMQEDFKRMDKKHKENQAIYDGNKKPFDKQGNIEGSFTRVTEAGTDAELDSLHEGHRDVAAGILYNVGNEINEKLHISAGDGSLKSSEPYRMRAECNSEEPFWGRQETRDNSLVHASNNNYASQHHSDRRWHKHRGTPEDLNRRHNPRQDSNRGRFGYGQGWKSEERYHQGARGETPYSKHFDERGHRFANKEHMDRQNLDKGYRNKINRPRYSNQRWGNKPPAQSAWSSTHDSRSWDQPPAQPAWSSAHDSRSWDQPPAQPAWASTHDSRSWDQSQQDWRQSSNLKTPTNANFGVLDSNISSSQRGSTGWVRKYDEYGQGQGGDPLSYSWQQGFDQGSLYERSNLFPERIEQPNVNVHNPDSNLAVQAEDMGNGKRQRFDFASKEAGASSQLHSGASRQPYQNAEARFDFASKEAGASSQPHSGASRQPYQNAEARSQPYWSAGAFSQPYREQDGGSRQAYHNTSTYQPYHNRRDNYRQGLPSGGFSRSRQSQEIRNL